MKIKILLIVFVTIAFKSNAQWTQTNGPGGGNTMSFLYDGGNLYAGSYLGGIFLSTNNGGSWSAVNNGLPPNCTIPSLAKIGSMLFASAGYDGVYVSTNGGNFWTAANNGLGSLSVGSLVVNGSTIFAGTQAGVYCSTNNGSNWTAVNTGLPGTGVIALSNIDSNLVVRCVGGVFFSVDNGNTWNPVDNSLPVYNVLSLASDGTNFLRGLMAEESICRLIMVYHG